MGWRAGAIGGGGEERKGTTLDQRGGPTTGDQSVNNLGEIFNSTVWSDQSTLGTRASGLTMTPTVGISSTLR